MILAALALDVLARAEVIGADDPERLIKLVVGYPPGGPVDTTARLAPQLAAIR